jgi:hypothetical protein
VTRDAAEKVLASRRVVLDVDEMTSWDHCNLGGTD